MTAPFGTAPICDGFEAMDRRIGVIGSLDAAGGKALFLRTYSPGVMVFETVVESFGDIRPALKKAGVHSVSRPVRVACNGSTVSVTTQDGTAHEVDTIYPARGCTVRSDLAAALGASANETGNLLVDQVQQTTVEGLYAAGDVASDLHQINVATAHAAIAATDIHNRLARHCVSDACRSSRAWRKRAHPPRQDLRNTSNSRSAVLLHQLAQFTASISVELAYVCVVSALFSACSPGRR